MDHLAIMRKSWGLLPKILNGEKTIESRWYRNKYSPWDKIKKGDTVYFKNSGGEPVTVKAEVLDVLQFSNLTPKKVKEILNEYGARDGLGKKEIDNYYEKFKDKNYCLLIFIKNPEKIEPFEVDKKGFGAMSAWITIDNIKMIRK
jgi:ASC-1-like (ASCH) protein